MNTVRKQPFFSIIIPTLNEQEYLPKLLDSVMTQSFRNYEVIVVDGSSADNTVKLARSYESKFNNLTVVTDRASLPFQRNLGAGKARGKWLLFIDADSILMPYALERMAVFIGAYHPSVFTTWCLPDTTIAKESILALIANLLIESSLILRRPLTPGPFTALRREVFDKIGGYDEAHAYNEDVDLGLRLFKSGHSVSVIRETLYVYSLRRIRKENKLKLFHQYVVSTLPILLFKKSFRYMPGYIMGGQLYNRMNKPIGTDVLKKYEQKLKAIFTEAFG